MKARRSVCANTCHGPPTRVPFVRDGSLCLRCTASPAYQYRYCKDCLLSVVQEAGGQMQIERCVSQPGKGTQYLTRYLDHDTGKEAKKLMAAIETNPELILEYHAQQVCHETA
jgi:hypothetical protein